jgi:hypothetical protein
VRITRTARRARLIAVAATGLLAAGALIAPTAQAAPTAPTVKTQALAAANVAKTLGAGATAGSYYDGKSFVVNITKASDAAAVRASGAVPKVVKYSSAFLSKADKATLATNIGGTSWVVDPKSNKLVVTADSTVTKAELAKLTAATASYGSAVRIERTASTFKRLIGGGAAIYGGAYRCSLGFNVVSGSTYYFLTAGHCGEVASTWYSNSGHTTTLGTNVSYSFPTNDYALVKYSITSHPGTVVYNSTTKDISSYGTPTVGQTVYKNGGVSGTTSGTVSALNSTVTFDDGSKVYGTIKTTACADGGDSGGPLFSGSVAYGMLSGGDGDCDSNPTGPNWFQPVGEALDAYGVSIY